MRVNASAGMLLVGAAGVGALVWLARKRHAQPSAPAQSSSEIYRVTLPDGTQTQGRNPIFSSESTTGERLYVMEVLYGGKWLGGIRVGDTQLVPKPGHLIAGTFFPL